nr:uncharacterized protein LOC105483873 [Macaca nemestrina]
MGSVMDRCWFSSLVREKMGILRDSMEKLPATWAWIPARLCSDVNTVVGAEYLQLLVRRRDPCAPGRSLGAREAVSCTDDGKGYWKPLGQKLLAVLMAPAPESGHSTVLCHLQARAEQRAAHITLLSHLFAGGSYHPSPPSRSSHMGTASGSPAELLSLANTAGLRLRELSVAAAPWATTGRPQPRAPRHALRTPGQWDEMHFCPLRRSSALMSSSAVWNPDGESRTPA